MAGIESAGARAAAAIIGTGLVAGGAVGIGMQSQRRFEEEGASEIGYTPASTKGRESQELWLTSAGAAASLLGGGLALFGHGAGLKVGGAALMGAGALLYGGAYLTERTMKSANQQDSDHHRLELYDKGLATPGNGGATATAEPVDHSVAHYGQRVFDAVDTNGDGSFTTSDTAAASGSDKELGVAVRDMAGTDAALDQAQLTDAVVRPSDSDGNGELDDSEFSGFIASVTSHLMDSATGATPTGDTPAAPDTSTVPTPTTVPQGSATDGGVTEGSVDPVEVGSVDGLPTGVPDSAPPGGWKDGEPPVAGVDAGSTYGDGGYAPQETTTTTAASTQQPY